MTYLATIFSRPNYWVCVGLFMLGWSIMDVVRSNDQQSLVDVAVAVFALAVAGIIGAIDRLGKSRA